MAASQRLGTQGQEQLLVVPARVPLDELTQGLAVQTLELRLYLNHVDLQTNKE